MKADNKLTTTFLLQHPSESARVLEQMSAAQVAEFLQELQAATATSVMTAMLPAKAAACCEFLPASKIAAFIAAMPTVAAAGILRTLSRARRDEITASLPEKNRKAISRHLKFPRSSIGAVMKSHVNSLPEKITVADAVRRASHFSGDVSGEIYITDQNNRLVGRISAGQLLKANQHARLSAVMNRKVYELSALADVATLNSHPAWQHSKYLPVVDRDRTLVGFMDEAAYQTTDISKDLPAQPSALDNLLSLGVFYWINAAQLLVGIFSVVTRGQEEKT